MHLFGAARSEMNQKLQVDEIRSPEKAHRECNRGVGILFV